MFPPNYFGPVGNIAGPGSAQVTLSFFDNPPTNTVPIVGANVWVTTDSAGQQVVAGPMMTNSSGNAIFMLVAGEAYYCWMEKFGIQPIEGAAFTAQAD